MRVDFVGQPAYTAAYCIFEPGEGIHTERGSMAFMSSGVDVQAALPGGVVRSWLRSRFADETMVMVHFVGRQPGSWVAVAPKYPGDILVADVTDDGLYVESGSVLAMSDTVDVNVRPAKLQNVLIHEGVTILHVHGAGKVLFSSYGSIERFTLEPGQAMVIDTGYLVAWTPSLEMRVGPLAGVVSTVLTGEGLVAEFTGPGDVYLQTRSPKGISSWIHPDHEQNTGH